MGSRWSERPGIHGSVQMGSMLLFWLFYLIKASAQIFQFQKPSEIVFIVSTSCNLVLFALSHPWFSRSLLTLARPHSKFVVKMLVYSLFIYYYFWGGTLSLTEGQLTQIQDSLKPH